MTYSTTDQHTSGMSAQRVEHPRILQGMKEICNYMGKSEKTVSKYIQKEGLPAAKIGGEWVSEQGKIDNWRVRRIQLSMDEQVV